MQTPEPSEVEALPDFRVLTIVVNRREPEDIRYFDDEFAAWEKEALAVNYLRDLRQTHEISVEEDE